jgi:hypothetical protein
MTTQRPHREPGEVRHEVEIDEARERVGDPPRPLGLETADGVDEVGEELGETFVENVTGADDAATAHRSEDTPGDEGGPFVLTTGEVEFAGGTDASNPAGAGREALPTVSAPPAPAPHARRHPGRRAS